MSLMPNIQLMSNTHANGRDTIPLRGDVFGSMGTGPDRKNFVIPNELTKKPVINLIRGRASFKLLNDGIVYPALFLG